MSTQQPNPDCSHAAPASSAPASSMSAAETMATHYYCNQVTQLDAVHHVGVGVYALDGLGLLISLGAIACFSGWLKLAGYAGAALATGIGLWHVFHGFDLLLSTVH